MSDDDKWDEFWRDVATSLPLEKAAVMHEQVSIQVGAFAAEVDSEIAPLIVELWVAGWGTQKSCQNHNEMGKVWVAFVDTSDVEAFLNAIATHSDEHDSLWRRASDFWFQTTKVQSEHFRGGNWEYHASVYDEAYDEEHTTWVAHGSPKFRVYVSVLFPRSDLQDVTERLRAFNAASARAAS